LGGLYLTKALNMLEALLQFDRSLFSLVNGQWHNDFFDWLMPWLRNSSVWAPLYLFVVLYAIINYKGHGWRLVLVALVAVALSDLLSSSLIKPNIFRVRPCNEPSLADTVRVLVGYRPQSSSFTSSHAVNHFTLATLLFLTLPKMLGKGRWLWFVWAGAICFAQVYVGVHYPLDVACGAIIGILIGYLHGRLFNKRYQLV
jgi:membrane-associated phospholipid phosphatase